MEWDRSTCLQSHWRGYICRKRVKLFCQLPDDLWNKIVDIIKSNVSVFVSVNKLINRRVTRAYWEPPFAFYKKKIHTLFLVRKYIDCLSSNTKMRAYVLSLRLLQFSNYTCHSNTLINATVELLYKTLRLLPA